MVAEQVAQILANREATNETHGNGIKKKESSYKIFKSSQPPEFTGTQDAINAHEWVSQMEALLTIYECDPQEKVKLATHTFKKEALHWWESIIQAQGTEAANQIPWERFLEMFTRQFCPISEKRRIEAEFLRLELGNMAYRDYVMKFNEMARFVPHLVTPEDNRIHRFIWGLPVEYRTFIKSTNPQTFYEAIEAGYSIAVELDRETVDNNKRKKGKSIRSQKTKTRLKD
ncbi:uncharacterized protein LOC143600580 [Bidens hawaiensis]|uniref:uncharacterized protein LOC143600580 n=1 Tax=Bidens hawaiensis TaxID=980011 RepID=UPI00404AF40F